MILFDNTLKSNMYSKATRNPSDIWICSFFLDSQINGNISSGDWIHELFPSMEGLNRRWLRHFPGEKSPKHGSAELVSAHGFNELHRGLYHFLKLATQANFEPRRPYFTVLCCRDIQMFRKAPKLLFAPFWICLADGSQNFCFFVSMEWTTVTQIGNEFLEIRVFGCWYPLIRNLFAPICHRVAQISFYNHWTRLQKDIIPRQGLENFLFLSEVWHEMVEPHLRIYRSVFERFQIIFDVRSKRCRTSYYFFYIAKEVLTFLVRNRAKGIFGVIVCQIRHKSC